MKTLLPPTVAVGLILASLLRVSHGVTRQSSTASALQSGSPNQKQPKHDAVGTLAVITQSHSTNSLGYRLVIQSDGSATAEIGSGTDGTGHPRSQEFPSRTVDAGTLRRLLNEVGDVSEIPTGTCPKSVSFGTRTEITFSGKTSGDLQCVRPQLSETNTAPLQASQELAEFVRRTLARLKITDRRFGPAR